MKTPLFSVGQSVMITASRGYHYSEGAYVVTATMPSGGGPIRYKVKNNLEKFERVIDESSLSAAQ